MNAVKPSFKISVDMTNPGQVIACCGLLELAHRLWWGVEAWFSEREFNIAVPEGIGEGGLGHLVDKLSQCEITGLTDVEREERTKLEAECRQFKKVGTQFPPESERRRQELGKRARAGMIHIAEPFSMILDWWQKGDDEATPKTWAGLQEPHKIARSAQDSLSGAQELTALMDFGCVLPMPKEYGQGKSASVEPFYFDAGRFSHSLDVGFSLDVQKAQTIAHPAVELLCLIGLQRFRPKAVPVKLSFDCLIGLQRFRPQAAPVKWSFDYWIWRHPLNAPVSAAVFCGASPVAEGLEYRFPLRFRDDQKRYKAFGRATLIGGES